MKHFVFLILSIISFSAFTQSVKQYSGEFTPPMPRYQYGVNYAHQHKGKASYSYYEDKEERRVFHGPFSFNAKFPEKSSNANKTYTIQVKGQYENDLMVGKWTIIEDNPFEKWNYTIEFSDGYPNGVAKGSHSWRESTTQPWTSTGFELTFKAGRIIAFKDIIFNGLSGQFDTDGNPVGTWEYNYNGVNMRQEFKSGLMTSSRFKRLSDGQVNKLSDFEYISPDTFFDNEYNNSGYAKVGQYWYKLSTMPGGDFLDYMMDMRREIPYAVNLFYDYKNLYQFGRANAANLSKYLGVRTKHIELINESNVPRDIVNGKYLEQAASMQGDHVEYYPNKPATLPEQYGDLQGWIQGNIIYTQDIISQNKYGKVTVKFLVYKDGSIRNAEIIKGKSEALDAEAIRVVESLPNFIPAQKRLGNGSFIPCVSEVKVTINFTKPKG